MRWTTRILQYEFYKTGRLRFRRGPANLYLLKRVHLSSGGMNLARNQKLSQIGTLDGTEQTQDKPPVLSLHHDVPIVTIVAG